MLDTCLKVLPLSLGAAVNPLGILIIFLLLAEAGNSLKKAWLFLAGSSSFLVLVIFAEHVLQSHTIGISHHPSAKSAGFDIAIGVILILLVIFRKKKLATASGDASGRSSAKSAKKERTALGNFLFGFVFMITDLSTLVLYFAALKLIFEDELSRLGNLVVLTGNLVIVMAPMVLPVFIATVMPQKSAAILDSVKRFIADNGQRVSKGVIFLVALYLIYKGGKFFV